MSCGLNDLLKRQSSFLTWYFMVTFPAVIESGSEATLCTSLLKPNETLQMTVYLVHDNQNRTLLQETVEEDFHHCSQFKAPQVEGKSVQEIRVDVKGESFEMTKKKKVMFKSYNPLTFIQTDKPIYNPGQTVNFRVVTVDANFVPLKQEYSVLTLEDNKGNRIGQWTTVSSPGLIVQLSHKLNPEAPEGQYILKANIGDRSITHHFKVKKYVLPRFEITVKRPEEQSVGEEELKIEVCGKYTYGQPVPGKALVQICRKFKRNFDRGAARISPCLVEPVEMKENGCASPVFNMTHFISSEFEQNLKDSLDVTVTVTEEGTDISMEKSESIKVTYLIGKVEFLDLPKNFERDTLLEGKIRVSTFSGKPIPNKKVYLLEGRSWSPTLLQNLTTDVNGLASFSVNTSDHSKTQISLMASVYPDYQHRGYNKPFFTFSEAQIALLQPATPYSPVYSELSVESLKEPIPCGSEISINIKYYIVGETTENYSTDIIYMVMSKGAIVHHGYEKVEVKESKKLIEGKVSFRLSVDVGLAPVVQILVYCVLPSGNIIAGSKNFNVEKCFRNKVSLQFSPTEAVPGEENTLQLSAQPGSLCGLSAVDQSVFIMEPGKRLNADEVFNLLPVKSVSGYNREVEDAQECLHVRPRQVARIDHTYSTIKGVGLKMATNLAIRKPECLRYGLWYKSRFRGLDLERLLKGQHRIYAVARRVIDSPSESESERIETVRKFFPETWIWQLAEVGDSGSTQVPVTVPDTITTWETDAFCLSSEGLGVAPPAQLRAFQPFFLELSLPYSIIRGEEFELKATVFSYLSKCIMVKVTPAPSSLYTLKASSDGEYSSCLCANGRKTFKWTLVPSVLGVLNVTVSAEAEQSQTVCDNEIVSVPERGRIDTVTRSLLVQAEGTEKTKSQSWFLCPQGNSVSEELELVVPEDVIEGSARASVSVLGDILGRALKNIDGLLKMPHGCGEQNIAILSPNIYILQYLENTGQLTAAIRERATGFLKSGYQRQLNYKHVDGAYSTFGRGEGNTWLTAFVLRTFGKAQRYIFIDPQNINSAKQWLINMQRPDGCFIRQGKLFNNRMKGGVNDDVTMTAYITASLLELGHTLEDPVLGKGLLCLKSSIGNLTNTYATALLAYTFSLAGEHDAREQLLKKLDSVAISGDGRLHWSQSASDDSDSLSVEISSYVLLAVLTTAEVTATDLGYANRIVSWLVRQQNPYGGYSSTQDTVVALQALALYSTKVFSSDGSSTVTVKSDKESHHFDVNQDNTLLYQEKQLQEVPGKYSISVEGSACVSVQAALFYNIPTPTETNTLSIEAKTDGHCTKPSGYTLSINFTVKYNGELNSTNMAIVDIKILSGFTADPSDVSRFERLINNLLFPCLINTCREVIILFFQLKNRLLVERVDTKDDHVIMYMKEVPKNSPMNYQLRLKQVLPVKNLKPAVIKVYDYYQTSDQSETEYSSPCV
ncbi:alpha-2-macroglobulin-like isoform X2 [Pygocentrus nattereri]|uniref:alpha-2-macroglobulin-like isoform X2 n=1 Tax=Pygocentrus nattereri TaxID=42514 RepID=UPI0018916001|nr:alpha-2-macroglobulin-like isoform X2 [Pygocentrus nattereri]